MSAVKTPNPKLSCLLRRPKSAAAGPAVGSQLGRALHVLLYILEIVCESGFQT